MDYIGLHLAKRHTDWIKLCSVIAQEFYLCTVKKRLYE